MSLGHLQYQQDEEEGEELRQEPLNNLGYHGKLWPTESGQFTNSKLNLDSSLTEIGLFIKLAIPVQMTDTFTVKRILIEVSFQKRKKILAINGYQTILLKHIW